MPIEDPSATGPALGGRSDPAGFEALLERARSGDRTALEALVARFYRRVEEQVHARLARDVRVGRPWLRARFSTGDVVQDVFRSVIGDLHEFYGSTEDGFCGWLAMVVRNRIVDSIRFHEAGCRDGRLASALGEDGEPWLPSPVADPAQAVARLEEAQRLERALAELGPRLHHLVRARLEGLASFRDLAEQLGYGSESSARRAFFEAQARLVLRLRDTRRPGDERG